MEKEAEIRRYVRTQMALLAKDGRTLEQSSSKAQLALLRRGAGKSPGELPELWGVFLKNMPEELMGKDGRPSYAEWAVYTALTLFALHQQGHSEPMHGEGEDNRLGRAARKLAHGDEEEENIRKKLSTAARSDDMTELSYHLKTVVRLLANDDIRLDYVDLAMDLYSFQFAKNADRIRLKWGQDFYRFEKTEDKGKEEKDEE